VKSSSQASAADILKTAGSLRSQLGADLHDRLTQSQYGHAARIVERCVRMTGRGHVDWDMLADRILTSRLAGFPIMAVGLATILWLTISGANAPSAMLFDGLFWIHDLLESWMNAAGAPWWLTGFLIGGVFRGLAWVVAVMLPPMAIFFPIFTLLEDRGVSAARRVQLGSLVSLVRRARQAIVDHGDGVWMQCGWGRRLPHY